MKLTVPLLKQHLLRQFNSKWITLAKITIHENDAKQKCEELGLKVYDPLVEFSKPKELDCEEPYVKGTPALLQDEPYVYPNDKTHPDWKEEPVFYHDNSTELLGGLKQAQNLTKSIVIQGMPERVQALIDNPVINIEDYQAERIVFKTHLLDAVQKKLPRIFEGPWTLNPYQHAKPYGPEKKRRNHSMINQLILTADRLATKVDRRLSTRILRKCPTITVPLDLHGKKICFSVTPAAILISDKSISPYASAQMMENLNTLSLPDIYPMHPTVNINPSNIYPTTLLSYVGEREAQRRSHIHFMLMSSDIDCFKQEENPEIIESALLTNAFATAVAQARRLYGADVRELPEPVTINVGMFHVTDWIFGSYQLNTIDLENSSSKNVFWLHRPQSLYKKADYVDGKPVLQEFSPDFLKYFVALYTSVS